MKEMDKENFRGCANLAQILAQMRHSPLLSLATHSTFPKESLFNDGGYVCVIDL